MNKRLLLGAHMSINGGVHTAFARGASIGCTTMQVFVKNNNQWHARPFTNDDIQNYKTEEAKAGVAPVIAHAAYLINLCAASAPVLKQSDQHLSTSLNGAKSSASRHSCSIPERMLELERRRESRRLQSH